MDSTYKCKNIVLDEKINDPRSPSGNHLEKLTSKGKNQYSIRMKSQWRLCFKWKNSDAHAVEIVDYH